ncbi:hypothetical protein Q8A73_008264 [Channa argus]|nr:hypothetical protein Q8A73_008264 [Channa argus]
MEPLWTDTGAPVRHANTYSDVDDHVAFGVGPPCDRQFFSFLSPVVCSVIGALRECLKQNWPVCSFSSGFGIVTHSTRNVTPGDASSPPRPRLSLHAGSAVAQEPVTGLRCSL